jgi:hypothetical protein
MIVYQLLNTSFGAALDAYKSRLFYFENNSFLRQRNGCPLTQKQVKIGRACFY